MSESLRMWVEIGFNILYLITIYALTIAMFVNARRVAPENSRLAAFFRWAFLLLALGDTGHVGFRVLAYSMGGLDGATVMLLGREVGLVGLGALSTAVTITFFYVLMLYAWRERYKKPLGRFGYFLIGAAAVRLVLMIPAINDWSATVPPQPWSLIRNLPLLIQGLGLASLVFRDAIPADDKPFKAIGWSIIVSYTFYTPVILFVQQVPMLGMLMIPKTLAYVVIAIIGWRSLYAQTTAA